MAVYNTTYNYNQGNMNFGQSMLLGAFGMLTGQMGGYGMGMGSYGMGCMGMGGSLFNMCGMGGYGMGGYGMGMYGCGMSDSYFGAQMGMMGMGILFQSINNSITERKAQKAATQMNAAATKINTVKTDAKSHLTVLDVASLDQFDSAKTVNDYSNEYRASVTSAEKSITNRQTEINNEKNQLGTRPTAVPEGETKTLAELQTEYDNKLSKLNSEYKILTDKTDKSNALVKEYLDAEAKMKERDKAIESAITALKPLKTQYDELNDQIKIDNNNENAKLEARCDSQGQVDDSKSIDEQTTTQGKFNKAYEEFKSSQNQTSLDKLKEQYNNLTGNKKSFTKLMKSIKVQHPNLDWSGIDL